VLTGLLCSKGTTFTKVLNPPSQLRQTADRAAGLRIKSLGPTPMIPSPQHRALIMAVAHINYIILFYFLEIVKMYIKLYIKKVCTHFKFTTYFFKGTAAKNIILFTCS
jgi:hypothetical protein